MATAVVVPDASVILKWVLPPADEADVAMRWRCAMPSATAMFRPWCRGSGCTKSAMQWRVRLPGQAERLLARRSVSYRNNDITQRAK